MEPIVILRKAERHDLDKIKSLVDKHRNELGFVIRKALERSIESSEIIVAVDDTDILLGFVHYRHRKDEQTTLYNIVVNKSVQRFGVGTSLVDELTKEAMKFGKHIILLKCPKELQANKFYHDYGFTLATTENGKVRVLNVWTLELK